MREMHAPPRELGCSRHAVVAHRDPLRSRIKFPGCPARTRGRRHVEGARLECGLEAVRIENRLTAGPLQSGHARGGASSGSPIPPVLNHHGDAQSPIRLELPHRPIRYRFSRVGLSRPYDSPGADGVAVAVLFRNETCYWSTHPIGLHTAAPGSGDCVCPTKGFRTAGNAN
jgi:hypothetical protein